MVFKNTKDAPSASDAERVSVMERLVAVERRIASLIHDTKEIYVNDSSV